MTANDVAHQVQGTFLTGQDSEGRQLQYAFASDLMSDVLTLTSNGVLFITGLCAPQTIRTAVVADIHTVLLVRGKNVPPSLVTLAKENEVTLIQSPYSMYRACGALYQAGLQPVF